MMMNNAPLQLDDRGLPAGFPFDAQWEVTPRQVRDLREGNEEFVLIDCRTPGEYETVHLEGSTLIPLQQVGEHVEQLRQMVDQKIITLCHHGGRSMKLAQLLRANGFNDVHSMAGGIHLWALDIDTSLPTY